MIRLLVGNSYSQLQNLTAQQLKEVQKLTDYKLDSNAVYHSGGFRSVRHLVDRKGCFPSGLLSKVATWMRDTGVKFGVSDGREHPGQCRGYFKSLGAVTPYPEQVEAVEACVRAEQGTVSMPTGTGKSFTMVQLVWELGLRTLIVVPSLLLKRQLQETFDANFGPTPDIVVENIDSNRLKSLTNFDVLIIDEAHKSGARTYRKLHKSAWSGIYWRFAFTAAPYRSREEENILMESVCGPVIYALDTKTAIAKGYIVPVEAYFVEVPPKATDGYSWAEVYSDLVVNNAPRNKIIQDLLMSLHTGGKSALCLVKEIAHGEALAQGNFAFANGQDNEASFWIKQFNDRKVNCLVATTGVAGEGVDSKPCEYVLITGLGKSKPAFMQFVGRALRRYPGKESAKVIIFLDKSHKWSKAHFAAQKKTLLDIYGVSVLRLEV